jgi:hypothetical protein
MRVCKKESQFKVRIKEMKEVKKTTLKGDVLLKCPICDEEYILTSEQILKFLKQNNPAEVLGYCWDDGRVLEVMDL